MKSKMIASQKKRSNDTDKRLFEAIKSSPGLSKYELSQKLGWSIGKTDGSIQRLLDKDMIIIKVVEREGRNVHLVYSSDERPKDEITVPENKLEKGNPLWMDEGIMYALDAENIGVTGKTNEEWKDVAGFSEIVKLKHEKGLVSFKIPPRFIRFYDMINKHHVVSINANNLIITVSGEIIYSPYN